MARRPRRAFFSFFPSPSHSSPSHSARAPQERRRSFPPLPSLLLRATTCFLPRRLPPRLRRHPSPPDSHDGAVATPRRRSPSAAAAARGRDERRRRRRRRRAAPEERARVRFPQTGQRVQCRRGERLARDTGVAPCGGGGGQPRARRSRRRLRRRVAVSFARTGSTSRALRYSKVRSVAETGAARRSRRYPRASPRTSRPGGPPPRARLRPGVPADRLAPQRGDERAAREARAKRGGRARREGSQ